SSSMLEAEKTKSTNDILRLTEIKDELIVDTSFLKKEREELAYMNKPVKGGGKPIGFRRIKFLPYLFQFLVHSRIYQVCSSIPEGLSLWWDCNVLVAISLISLQFLFFVQMSFSAVLFYQVIPKEAPLSSLAFLTL